MSHDVLIAAAIFGSGAIALVVALGGWVKEVLIRRTNDSSAADPIKPDLGTGSQIQAELKPTHTSTSHKTEIAVAYFIFACLLALSVAVASHFPGVAGNVARAILSGISGEAKIAIAGTLFLTLGFGFAMFFWFLCLFDLFLGFCLDTKYWHLLVDKLLCTSLGCLGGWLLVLFLLLDTRPRWFWGKIIGY